MSKPTNKISQECYMCNAIATSNEHVPPKCLFPHEKDSRGTNYRKDLITVPSCYLHNSEKSQDDEFLMAALAPIVGNNIVGYQHTHTKIKRSLDRKNIGLNNYTIYNEKPIILRSRKGYKFDLLRGTPNLSRLDKCFTNIAYGIFYYKYKKRFEGDVKVFAGFVKYSNPNYERLKLLARIDCTERINSSPILGENPDVFAYQIFPPDSNGILLMRFVFYGASDVFISLKPKDTPFNLTLELAKISESVIFTSSNGQQITISRKKLDEQLIVEVHIPEQVPLTELAKNE